MADLDSVSKEELLPLFKWGLKFLKNNALTPGDMLSELKTHERDVYALEKSREYHQRHHTRLRQAAKEWEKGDAVKLQKETQLLRKEIQDLKKIADAYAYKVQELEGVLANGDGKAMVASATAQTWKDTAARLTTEKEELSSKVISLQATANQNALTITSQTAHIDQLQGMLAQASQNYQRLEYEKSVLIRSLDKALR